MISGVIGKKIDQTQRFLEDGTRIPVTIVAVPQLSVVAIRTKDKNGYFALQVKSDTPKILREIQFSKKAPIDSPDSLPKVGDLLKATDILKPGDIVHVTGISKGKGFAGGVKRHHFKGGPRTHGQSDRERAPGSIGQTTTPGRVYKGKRMAGHMGVVKSTAQNLKVIDISDSEILIKGLIPGSKNSIVTIAKVGEDKKFTPLLKKQVDEVENIEKVEEKPQEASKEPPIQETPVEETKPVEQPKEESSDAKAKEDKENAS